MSTIETFDYEDSKLPGLNWHSTRTVPLAADTYYTGMLLEFDSTAGAYKALDVGTIAGVYTGDDERVLATTGYGDIIVAGEVLHSKLVDADGASLTLTETEIATYAQSGIYVKER